MTPEDIAAVAEGHDWTAIRDGDTMIAEGETLEWLIRQLIEWPHRIHPERTTNMSFLMCTAARTLEALRGDIEIRQVCGAVNDKALKETIARCNAAEALLAEARDNIRDLIEIGDEVGAERSDDWLAAKHNATAFLERTAK